MMKAPAALSINYPLIGLSPLLIRLAMHSTFSVIYRSSCPTVFAGKILPLQNSIQLSGVFHHYTYSTSLAVNSTNRVDNLLTQDEFNMKDRPTFSIEDSLKAFRVQFCLFVANVLLVNRFAIRFTHLLTLWLPVKIPAGIFENKDPRGLSGSACPHHISI
jgi:hypothetical protein